MKNLPTFLFAAAFAGATLAPHAAHASSPDTVKFAYNPADLTTLGGKQKILNDIETLAAKTCSKPPKRAFNFFHPTTPRKLCRADIKAQLLSQINNPQLSELARKGDIELADASR